MKEQNTIHPNADSLNKTKEKLKQSIEKYIFETSEVSVRSKVYVDFANALNRKIFIAFPSFSLP